MSGAGAEPGIGGARLCGECTICCRFYAVPEIGKPEQEWCGHCGPGGCGIHLTRPQPCRNFSCFWLMDETFPEDLRPDRCGIVAAFNGDDHESVVLHLDPDRPDALAEPPGSELLAALLTRFDPVCIVCGEDRMTISRQA